MNNKLYKLREIFHEIYFNLRAHKLRTILTSFGISWGVFILVVLLGVSGGIQEGVLTMFKGFSTKTIWFYGGQSDDNKALRESGRQISFNLNDLESIRKLSPNIISITPDIIKLNNIVYHKSDWSYFNIKGITENKFRLQSIRISKGRHFNKKDMDQNRYVAIITDRADKHFFPRDNALGNYIRINNTQFLIVGVVDNNSYNARNEYDNIFLPFTTFGQTIQKTESFNSFGITISEGDTKWYANRIKQYLARKYSFNLDDSKALYIVNYEEQMDVFSKFFSGLNIFLLFIGCCLLLSGIIGVSNIMYIIVKERTREIGIKKALGAPSVTILREYIAESLVLTLAAGLIGYLLGIGALKVVDLVLTKFVEGDQIINQTNVDIKYLIISILLLSLSGIISGFFPARKAAQIKPVEAIVSL